MALGWIQPTSSERTVAALDPVPQVTVLTVAAPGCGTITAMTSQGLLREARAGVFTLVCLSLSVALHAWASGSAPAPTAIVAGAGLVLVAAAVLAGRERGFPVIVGVLLTAQCGLHYLFEAIPHAGHHAVVVAPAAGPSASAMVTAHVLAGVFTAAWLRGGEAAVWRLGRWLARRVVPFRALWTFVRVLVTIPPRGGLRWASEHPVALPAPDWRHSVVRRGPPAVLATLR